MSDYSLKPKTKSSLNHDWFYYLFYAGLALFLVVQLGLTLYQVGLSISYQAKLAQLNRQYQLLTKEKTDLGVALSSQLNLGLAQAKAQSAGFVKLKAVALNQPENTLAVLP